jgi:hypothetical protein
MPIFSSEATLALQKDIHAFLIQERTSLLQDLEVSAQIDARLELPIARIEKMLAERTKLEGKLNVNPIHNNWIGLRPEALQTGYLELATLVRSAGERFRDKRWVDFGCAYGRLGLVLSAIFPEASFLGIESVGERLTAARAAYQKLNIPQEYLLHARLEELDLKNLTPLPSVYFIYDFSTRENVSALLECLKEISKMKAICVVARGRGTQNWIDREHPWLSQVNPPLRFESASIFYS